MANHSAKILHLYDPKILHLHDRFARTLRLT